MNDENYILKHIKELCEQRKWSNYTLAEKSGLSRSTISNLFKRTNQPTFSTLCKICDAFEITLAQFFEPNESNDLTAEQRELIKSFNSLDKKEKLVTKLFVESLLQIKE